MPPKDDFITFDNTSANIITITLDRPVKAKTNLSELSISNESLNPFINVNSAYVVITKPTIIPSGAYIAESINFKMLPIVYIITVLFTIDKLLEYSLGLFTIFAIINSTKAISAIAIANIMVVLKKFGNNSASFIAFALSSLNSAGL